MGYNRKSSYVITAAATYPVTLTELKAFLRVDTSDDDTMLNSMISAATDAAEQFTGRKFISTTMGLRLDGFNSVNDDRFLALGEGVHDGAENVFFGNLDAIYLPMQPVVSVTSIKTYDKANAESTLTSAAYRLDGSGRIYLNDGYSWPVDLRNFEGVLVTYVAGYGASASAVPASIKQSITDHAAQMYECRGACGMSDACKALLSPFRVIDLSWC